MSTSHTGLRPFSGAAFSVGEDGEERLVLVQEVDRSALRNLDPNKVITTIREAILARHEIVPYAIFLIKPATIPKTSSGKIQRHACRDAYLADRLHIVGNWRQGDAVVPSAETVAEHPPGRSEHDISRWLCMNLAQRMNLPVTAKIGRAHV